MSSSKIVHETLNVSTMFGPVELKYTKCPLSRYPINVGFDGDISQLNISRWKNGSLHMD